MTLLDTTCAVCSILKQSKYTAALVSIDNETQCVPLLCLSSRFMTYTSSFILGKLSLEKNTIKPRLIIEILSRFDID